MKYHNQTYVFVALCIMVLLFNACKSDSKSGMPITTDEEIPSTAKDVVADQSLVDITTTQTFDEEALNEDELITEDEDHESNKNISNTQEQQADETYQKSVDIQKENSIVAKQFMNDCEAILTKYKTTIEKFLKTENEAVLDEILEWSNDPVFLSCQNNMNYKEKFEEVNRLLE